MLALFHIEAGTRIKKKSKALNRLAQSTSGCLQKADGIELSFPLN